MQNVAEIWASNCFKYEFYLTLKIDFDVIIYKQAFLTTYIPGNLYSNSDVSTEKNK